MLVIVHKLSTLRVVIICCHHVSHSAQTFSCNELKLTKVIPIFKNGDKTDITNYRPISVLSFFSKFFEKTINNCLIKFIDKHDILYKYQFGFRKSHSTSHAIISLVEKINNALDSGKFLIVFFGFKKSFRHSKSQNSSR